MENTDTTMQQLQTASNFQFSAVNIDELGATEYTLATIVVDISSSVYNFKNEIENCLKTILTSCQKSGRAENLMLRLIAFNNNIQELHGFRLLNEIQPDEYNNILSPSGMTALYDATQSAIEASGDYGKMLLDQDFSSNAVIYIITDGCDNASTSTKKSIKNTLKDIQQKEVLESCAVILIGVGYADASIVRELDSFKQDSELSQFVDLTELFQKSSPENTLAKLAGYISKSVSTTSQALANGDSQIGSSLLTF